MLNFQRLFGMGSAMKTLTDEDAGSLARLSGPSPLTDVFPMVKPRKRGRPQARAKTPKRTEEPLADL